MSLCEGYPYIGKLIKPKDGVLYLIKFTKENFGTVISSSSRTAPVTGQTGEFQEEDFKEIWRYTYDD